MLLATGVGYFLSRLPFEVTELVANLLRLQASPSAWHIFTEALSTRLPGTTGFLRPGSWLSTKAIFDLSQGQYFIAYRSVHLLTVLGLMLSLVRLARVRSSLSFAVCVVSMMVLVGIHPFHEAVRETELNIKLLNPLFCFAALLLCTSRPHWTKDVAALALFVYASLANELGLLVWVVVAAASIVGFRGVSRRGVLLVSAALIAYMGLRFTVWHQGAPGLSERSSGFGLRMYDPDELTRMFQGHPYPFYAYNVVAAWLDVLFSEPRNGAFLFIRCVMDGEARPGHVLQVLTSLLTTGVIATVVLRRGRSWLRRDIGYHDAILLVSLAVLAANAAISFPYVKDITMSTGAAFYALAVFVALHEWVAPLTRGPVSARRVVLVGVCLTTISIGWTVRAAGFFQDVRVAAYKARNDWVTVRDWQATQGLDAADETQAAMIERVRGEMLLKPTPTPYAEPAWLGSLDPLH